MLSKKTIEIVKATAPVLEEKGTEITKHFYKKMFAAHPELLNIFNHANQGQGRQQTALANALYAAAQHIEQLEAILPVVQQVGYKHRGLGVKKEHYPIVGENLLAAMKEVLGNAATDDVINAWAEAYDVIANVFIDVEAKMYDQAEEQQGGWRFFKPFVVANKVKESSIITSFYLKTKDGDTVPTFLPGQYITIRVKVEGETYVLNRQYTLSDAPGNDYFRISVKREAEPNKPEGKVSNYLHDHIDVGDEIEISAPAGDFTLDTAASTPVVLLSGGVGITPMMSMFNTIAKQNKERSVTFIHAARNEEVQAFKNTVKEIIENLENAEKVYCYDKPVHPENADIVGHITKDVLENYVKDHADYYICGPVPFMKAMITNLQKLGVKEENIHYEFFGPALNIEQTNTPIKAS
ncbi:NO-inducible flavohemoprotein [Bacillus aquiflavi]|uniref:NO-inducible flavohemoprotein n=1 Tax=Bacillus aquiflavi TaxID=2672567 RepID=UPI001CA944D5|nr:NO-inducible flavohemoprotein [Bacillus aquiflavi]UAC48367.1 NO-inducible flavohemoprotein [Bacillus aquiflavi]